MQPAALHWDHPATDLAGGMLVGLGLIVMGLAVVEMTRQKTTVVPHMEASHLVTKGIFARSRNPIYLGDALVLAGLALRWDSPVALVLVPVFMAIITWRFIIPEEMRLASKFGADFTAYCARTRRWV